MGGSSEKQAAAAVAQLEQETARQVGKLVTPRTQGTAGAQRCENRNQACNLAFLAWIPLESLGEHLGRTQIQGTLEQANPGQCSTVKPPH